MHARMGGGLLQDTVSPLGDMVHYLAKASFLQDMLLGMFVFYLSKASFLQDMLLGMFVCLFVFFLYVIIFAQHLLSRQALHQYNISCIVVTK